MMSKYMKQMISLFLTVVMLSSGLIAFAKNEIYQTKVEVPRYKNVTGGAYCKLTFDERLDELVKKTATSTKRSLKESTRSAVTNDVDGAYDYMYDAIVRNMDENIDSAFGYDVVIDLSQFGIEITFGYDADGYGPVVTDSTYFDELIGRLSYESGELMIRKNWGYNSDFYNYCYYDENDELIWTPGVYNLTVLAVNFIFEPEETKEKIIEVDNVVDPFIESLDSSLSDVEKILLVHDFVANNTTYDSDNMGDEPDDEALILGFDIAHSMYGTLVKGSCGCQGYAEAMSYILDKIGIDNAACVCDVLDHVWNCVKVNNKWYHVDSTWDDVNPDNSSTGSTAIEYSNFLVGLDNIIDTQLVVPDSAGNEAYRYGPEELLYTSHNLTNEDTENYDFASGYIFNNIVYYPCKLDDSDNIYSLDPQGFTYVDGKLILTINSTISNGAAEYTFTYDSIDAMPYAISKPQMTDNVWENNDLYTFVMIGAPDDYSQISLTMSDENMEIDTVSLIPVWMEGFNDYYFYAVYSDTQKIAQVQNAKFFCWDGFDTMTPLSYVITQ